jgi:hypothetical protein
VLWATYSEVSISLESSLIGYHSTAIASISGGVAGAMQAVAAAPVENVRLIVEGGSARSGWANAWKEVFVRSQSLDASVANMEKSIGRSKAEDIKKAREVRDWVRDIRGMAGRGWEGLGWGVMKDACGMGLGSENMLKGILISYQALLSFSPFLTLRGGLRPELKPYRRP